MNEATPSFENVLRWSIWQASQNQTGRGQFFFGINVQAAKHEHIVQPVGSNHIEWAGCSYHRLIRTSQTSFWWCFCFKRVCISENSCAMVGGHPSNIYQWRSLLGKGYNWTPGVLRVRWIRLENQSNGISHFTSFIWWHRWSHLIW